MEEKVNIKRALRVYQYIVDKGERQGDEYRYAGLRASSDFDGYNVTIQNDYASLTILFHNKMNFSFTNTREKVLFLEALEKLDKKLSEPSGR